MNANIRQMKIKLSKRGSLALAIILFIAIIGPLRPLLMNAPIVGGPFQYLYFGIDQLKFWGPDPTAPSQKLIQIPTLNGAPLSGKPIGAHFRAQNSSFILTADTTKVYAKPSESSHLMRTLPPGARVRSVYVSDDVIVQTSEGRGQWAFITEDNGITPIGWVVDITLGYQDRFIPSENWTIPAFGLCIGEYCGEITVKHNGRFTEKWDSVGKGIHLQGVNTGQALTYRKIVWIKQDDPEDYDELLVLENTLLHHEVKYAKEPIRNSKMKGKRLTPDFHSAF